MQHSYSSIEENVSTSQLIVQGEVCRLLTSRDDLGQLHRMGIIPKANRSASIPGAAATPARTRPKGSLLDTLSGKDFTGKGKGRGWEDFRDRGDRMVDDEEDADKEDDDDGSRRKGKRELDEVTTETGGRLVNGREGEELSEGVRKMKVL